MWSMTRGRSMPASYGCVIGWPQTKRALRGRVRSGDLTRAHSPVGRRKFLGAATMLCLTGGAIPGTRRLVAAADAQAATSTMQMDHGAMQMDAPHAKPGPPSKTDPVDSLKSGTPQPQPGGVA